MVKIPLSAASAATDHKRPSAIARPMVGDLILIVPPQGRSETNASRRQDFSRRRRVRQERKEGARSGLAVTRRRVLPIPPAAIRQRTGLAERHGPLADLLAVPPQELVGANQPGKVRRKLRLHRLLCRAVHAAVALVLLAEADADQRAQRVRVRGQRDLRVGEEVDLVGTGLADSGEPLELSPRLFRIRPDELAEALAA